MADSCNNDPVSYDTSDWIFTTAMYKAYWWWDASYAVGYTFVKNSGAGTGWAKTE